MSVNMQVGFKTPIQTENGRLVMSPTGSTSLEILEDLANRILFVCGTELRSILWLRDFGADSSQALFTPLTEADANFVLESMQDSLDRYMNGVVLTSLQTTSLQDGDVKFDLFYTLSESAYTNNVQWTYNGPTGTLTPN